MQKMYDANSNAENEGNSCKTTAVFGPSIWSISFLPIFPISNCGNNQKVHADLFNVYKDSLNICIAVFTSHFTFHFL